MTKAENKTFLALLEEVPEYRKGNAIKYSLRDVLFLAIFAILCGAETYTGMQVFSELHINELRKYLELPNGIPSHDVFGDILSRVDIKAVNECFRVFTESLEEVAAGNIRSSFFNDFMEQSKNASDAVLAYLKGIEVQRCAMSEYVSVTVDNAQEILDISMKTQENDPDSDTEENTEEE